jgi:hypothetical protein
MLRPCVTATIATKIKEKAQEILSPAKLFLQVMLPRYP